MKEALSPMKGALKGIFLFTYVSFFPILGIAADMMLENDTA